MGCFLIGIIFCVLAMSIYGGDIVIDCSCNKEKKEALKYSTNIDFQTELSEVAIDNPNHIDPPPPVPFNSNSCKQENQELKNLDGQKITWPETEDGKFAVSHPLCIDESLKIATRLCKDGIWNDAPNCKTVQQLINPCPSNLASVNAEYCYTIIKKTQFPPNCPYPGELGWNKIIGLKDIFPEGPIWMPLKRTDSVSQGIDVLRYTEISDNYYKPFQICTQSCRTFFYQESFLDKQCLVYHNSTHIEAVSCDAEYAALCIYDTLNNKQSSICSQNYKTCKQGGYDTTSICFCKTNEQNIEQKILAEFLQPYQSLLFKDEACRIGLQNTKDESTVPFRWINSKTILNYTSWSLNVNFDYKYGVQTESGWTLTDVENGSCLLYQIDAPKTEGTLSLVIEGASYKLTLTNYTSFLTFNNEDPVVYCYTDADAQSIIYQIPNSTVTETSKTDNEYTMKFPPISLGQSGPGNYWCTAFLYPDLNPVTSQRVLIWNFQAEYVVLLKLKHYEEKLSKYPLTKENLETLQNLFKNDLPNSITFYPRIFKINGIDETKKEINITFHLTSSEASSTLEEFYMLRNISKAQTMFEFLDFRSVLYCPQSTSMHGGQKIIWPQVEALSGQTHTYPQNGHCVTRNVSLIQRTCSGNFVDGVYWSDVTESCHYFSNSTLTDSLINITNESGDDKFSSALIALYEVSKKYDSFNTLDFGLAVKFITQIAFKKVDLDILADIISNLMNIPRVVLLSAQINFKSTDTLLKAIDTLWQNGDFGEWNKPNFAVRSINLKTDKIFGYQLQMCNVSFGCDLNPIKNTNVLYNQSIILKQDVITAISLSNELYEQILKYGESNETYLPKLIIIFYYGSQLFVEIENSKSSNVVFGVLLPEFPSEKDFNGPVLMYYYTNVNNRFLKYNCSYWRFNDSDTSSWLIEDTKELGEAVVCEFYHITNFGVPSATVNPECSNEELFCTQMFVNEFCTTKNLTLIPTKCFQNFTDGKALLSDISSNCTTYQLTNRIENISEIFPKNVTYELIMDLLDSLNNEKAIPSEVELTMAVLCMKMVSNKVNMSKFADIVNTLMNVPESILLSAQINFKAMDLLLTIIEEALINAENGEWKTDNFVIEAFRIDDEHLGVSLENCSANLNNCDIKFVNRDNNRKENLSKSNNKIFASVFLSDKLYKQINNYSLKNNSYIPKLVISIFHNSNIFVDVSANQDTNMVFDVLLPDFNEELQGPLTIYYFQNLSSIQYNCSYWKFNYNSYGSWQVESSFYGVNVAACEFYHLSNFAINSKIHTNLIDSRYLAISSNQTCDKNNFLSNFLQYPYYNFLAIEKTKLQYQEEALNVASFNISKNIKDVYTIINCLEPSSITLEFLADTINDLPSIFLKSSKNILNAIDIVLSNVQDTNQINKENIAFITISKEDAQYFKGFYITNFKDIVCIYKEINFKELDFNIAVTVDNKLRQQIKQTKSNLAFALFYNDFLFPNLEKSKAHLPIVAVLIPNLHPKSVLRGNLTIKYKSSNKGHCSYWQNSINKPGFWKLESKANFFDADISTCDFNHVTNFALIYESQNITANLQQILDSNLTAREKLLQVNSITALNPNNLVAVDIYLISQIITNSLSEVILPGIVTKIISSLFTVPRAVLRESQETHSATDIILYTVDQMVKKIDDEVMQHYNFSLIVKNLSDINMTGIMLHDCEDYKCSIEMLHEFINISDYTSNTSINAMVTFSEELVKQIKNNSKNPKVAISTYYSDVLFNEASLARNTSKIFGVTFPGLNDELKGSVSVIFNVGNRKPNDTNQCAYWNYRADPSGNNATHGQWMNDTNEKRKDSMSICSYTHVTHFGMLLSNNNEYDNDPILDLITDVGCILSLFGIFVILLTALFYKKWRQNTGNIILINFSVAITLKIITLYVSVYVKTTSLGLYCTITGVLLHYAILSECTWMLTVAILQFKRFVEVLGGPPKYVLIKALICGWVFPVIPVTCVIAIDPNNYQEGIANLCYPSDLGLYLGVWLPVLLILTINCIIFIFIIYNVFHKKTEYIDNSNHEILFQWRLALLLFFMLGLNGAFGFLGQINGELVFIYLFTITASLQGFVLFLFFIVFNKSTRFLYSQSIKQWFYARGIFKVWHQNSKPINSKY